MMVIRPPPPLLDDLDLQILREIGIEPFLGAPRGRDPWNPRRLAAKLKASPRLVKDRVARMDSEGMIDAYEAFPNLGLLGLEARSYLFRFAKRSGKRDALARLADVDGYLAHVDYLSDIALVSLAYRGEAERERKLNLLAGVLDAFPETWFAGRPPAVARQPTALDWRILRVLRPNARRPLHEIAAEVGVSTKTVHRRVTQLAKEGAFDPYARLSSKSLDHILFCSLTFRLEPGKEREVVGRIHGDLLNDAWSLCNGPLVEGGAHVDLVAASRSPAGLRAMVERAERVPGVRDIEGHLATTIEWSPAWLDEQIDRKIANFARAA